VSSSLGEKKTCVSLERIWMVMLTRDHRVFMVMLTRDHRVFMVMLTRDHRVFMVIEIAGGKNMFSWSICNHFYKAFQPISLTIVEIFPYT
jgi:hypothetical protein